MPVTSDTQDLLRNALGVCTPLPRLRPLGGGGEFRLSNNDTIPVRVTVWGATSRHSPSVQYDCLETTADLRHFERFRVRWQNDGVSVSTDISHARFSDGVLTGIAHGVAVQEGRNNTWHDNVRFGVTFADHYITTPLEIKERLERALSSSTV